jgi:hypothetical protein
MIALILVALSLGLSNFAAAIGIGIYGSGPRARPNLARSCPPLIRSANLRHTVGVNRSSGPRPSCLVSRTATLRVAWPTSTQFPPLLLL